MSPKEDPASQTDIQQIVQKESYRRGLSQLATVLIHQAEERKSELDSIRKSEKKQKQKNKKN